MATVSATQVLLTGGIFESMKANTRDHAIHVKTPDGEKHVIRNAGVARKIYAQYGDVYVRAVVLPR